MKWFCNDRLAEWTVCSLNGEIRACERLGVFHIDLVLPAVYHGLHKQP